MIWRRTSSVPKEDVVFLDCSSVISGAPRLVAGAPRLVINASRFDFGTSRLCALVVRLDFHPPMCSESAHNHSHGTPGTIIADSKCSESRPECPSSVWYSSGIDALKFILHILSDSPGGFQQLRYNLLMNSQILQQLKPVHRSAGDYESSGDRFVTHRMTWCRTLHVVVS